MGGQDKNRKRTNLHIRPGNIPVLALDFKGTRKPKPRKGFPFGAWRVLYTPPPPQRKKHIVKASRAAKLCATPGKNPGSAAVPPLCQGRANRPKPNGPADT